jgi:hypothetical protein
VRRLLVVTAVVLSACGSSSTTTNTAPHATTGAPTAVGPTVAAPAPVAAATASIPANFPPEFVLPHTQVTQGISTDAGPKSDYLVGYAVADASSAYAAFQTQLPAAGWTINSKSETNSGTYTALMSVTKAAQTAVITLTKGADHSEVAVVLGPTP